jgi:hypothetical protein
MRPTGIGEGKALAADQRSDLGATPHRKIEPQRLDGFGHVRRAALLAAFVSAAAIAGVGLCQRYRLTRDAWSVLAACSVVRPSAMTLTIAF